MYQMPVFGEIWSQFYGSHIDLDCKNVDRN